jgi:hypothetical protein
MMDAKRALNILLHTLQWEDWMTQCLYFDRLSGLLFSQSVFQYDVTACETKVIPVNPFTVIANVLRFYLISPQVVFYWSYYTSSFYVCRHGGNFLFRCASFYFVSCWFIGAKHVTFIGFEFSAEKRVPDSN